MLDGSQLTLGGWDEDRLIAFARVITDDLYRAVIDDVVVESAYRERGIASQMIEKVLMRLQHIEVIMLDCSPELWTSMASSASKSKTCHPWCFTIPGERCRQLDNSILTIAR